MHGIIQERGSYLNFMLCEHFAKDEEFRELGNGIGISFGWDGGLRWIVDFLWQDGCHAIGISFCMFVNVYGICVS